jgi:hypothetical protein
MTVSFLSSCLVLAVVVVVHIHHAVQGFALQPVASFAVRLQVQQVQQQLQLQLQQQQLHAKNGSFSSRHGFSSLFQSTSNTITDSDSDSDTQVFDADRHFALSRIRTHKSEKDDPEWKFFDTARIHDGGTGCVAFRREKGESRMQNRQYSGARLLCRRH